MAVSHFWSGLCRQLATLLLPLLLLLARSKNGVIASTEVSELMRKPYVTNYDWESTVVARGKGGCTLAKKPDFRPPPLCPTPRTPVSRDTASKLGWKFAPILYQHPLDESWLTNPVHWLDEAVSYNTRTWRPLSKHRITIPRGVVDNEASSEYLSAQGYFASRLTVPSFNQTSKQVTFDTDDGPTLLRKAVMDPLVNGRLTGKVWYTVFRPYDEETGDIIPNAYVYTYHYWYPWNGCSNQLVATQVDGRKQGVEYFMCADGAHEGDLEHIKVYVCEDDMLNDDPSSAIQRTQYSQHGWLPDFDCKADECHFDVDEVGTRRLVTYAALGSHANWPWETPLFVYAKIRLNFLLNMDGLYLGDRFKQGPVFYPDQNNTAFLPFVGEMTDEQKDGEFAWAMFPGVWGGTITQTGRRTITCLYDNFTRLGSCPTQNPAYFILDLLLKPKGWNPEEIDWIAVRSGNTVSGPLWRRAFSYSWEMERESPLYTISQFGRFNLTFDGYCPLEAPYTDTVSNMNTISRLSLKQYLGVMTGLVLFSAIVACAMVLPALLVRADKTVLKEIADEMSDRKLAEKSETEPPAGTAASAEPATATEPPAPEGPKLATKAAGEGSAVAGDLKAPPPDVAQPEAGSSVLGAGASKSRMTAMMLSHRAILRAYHASVMQPYFMAVWVFVGIALYIAGLVLGVIGVYDCVTALNSIVRLSIWKVVGMAINAAFVVFGVIHVAITITSLWVRPLSREVCACGPQTVQERLWAVRQSWTAQAVLVGLLVMEMNVTMLMFAFGMLLWVARYGMTEACFFAVKSAFLGLEFLDDVCVDLSSIGLPDRVCGSQLTDLCGIWGGLNVDYLSFGCMLFLIAQAMFLVLATTNYVGTRTGYAIMTVILLSQKTEAARASDGNGPGSGGSGYTRSFLFGRKHSASVRRDRGANSGPEGSAVDKTADANGTSKGTGDCAAARIGGSAPAAGRLPGGGGTDKV